MADYHFPYLRRSIFLGVLLLIVAMAFVPALTRGTVNIRIYSLPAPFEVQHVYLKVSQLELHTAGLPSDIGWVSITNNLPTLDVVSQSGVLVSSSVPSGRYDGARLSFSQGTVALGSTAARTVCQGATCTPLVANMTLPVRPGGYADGLIVISPNYASLLSQTPSLSVSVVDANGAA